MSDLRPRWLSVIPRNGTGCGDSYSTDGAGTGYGTGHGDGLGDGWLDGSRADGCGEGGGTGWWDGSGGCLEGELCEAIAADQPVVSVIPRGGTKGVEPRAAKVLAVALSRWIRDTLRRGGPPA